MVIIGSRALLGEPTFEIKNATLLLIEGLKGANARDIRTTLDECLQKYYELSLSSFLTKFTMVTDGSVPGASVSSYLHISDDNWMRCMVHFEQRNEAHYLRLSNQVQYAHIRG